MKAPTKAPTKAMVLAAGLGTRLRPLTDSRPKALVEINGRSLLEITLLKLRAAGVREVIVNAHHFADMIVDTLKQNNNLGMNVEVSREEVLLDTGGGLKKAAWFFLRDSSGKGERNLSGKGERNLSGKGERNASGKDEPNLSAKDEPFILHNVDVISNVDLARMAEFHAAQNALATLMVQDRKTSRYLLFDEQGILCGRRSAGAQSDEIARPASARQAPSNKDPQALAFSGIHIISRASCR